MNPEENAEKNTFVAHYLNEWSMWMDTHPGGLKRITEKNNADENSADDAGKITQRAASRCHWSQSRWSIIC